MLSGKVFKRIGIAFSISAIATLVPFSVSSKGTATVNDACADGACCRELGSFCGYYPDNYTSLSGYCRIKAADSAPAGKTSGEADA